MKYLVALLFLTSVLLIACSGSPADSAIATGVASTMEAQVVQTAVIATQRVLDTPTPEPQTFCIEEAEEYFEALDDLAGRWDDANEIASSTSRISLAQPVAELQAVRREIADLEGPECAADVGIAMYNYADRTIEGYLLFMQDGNESLISNHFDKASEWLEKYFAEIDRISSEPMIATREAASATRKADATSTAEASD